MDHTKRCAAWASCQWQEFQTKHAHITTKRGGFLPEEELERQPLDTATHFLHITGSKAQESYVLVTIPAPFLSILRRTVDSLVYLNVNNG